jgi:hypothetical protein
MENIDKIHSSVVNSSYGLSMGAIWQHICIACSEFSDDYLFKKNVFFDVLARLLNENKIKLAANGTFWSGTIEEQLEILQTAWPQYPSDDEDDDLDDYGMWFLVKAPAGVVWLTSDGRELWT